jgi:SrtB family sortase
MKNKKLTKNGKIIAALIAAALIITAIWMAGPLFSPKPTASAEPTAEETETPSPTPTATPEDTSFAKEYNDNKQINPEYIGKLEFESGLVVQNLTQTSDNEKYLNTAWDTTVNNEGAAFMDYRNTLSDQNMIIYGHYVYYDGTKMFTPLENLMDQNNYEANKYIDISFSSTDKRKYVITDVFYYQMQSETLKYYKVNYDSDFFAQYYSAVKEADFYDTGETLTMDDHWISLQTCVRNHDELREIVLAKQVN